MPHDTLPEGEHEGTEDTPTTPHAPSAADLAAAKTKADLKKMMWIVFIAMIVFFGIQMTLGRIFYGDSCWNAINYAGFFIQFMCIVIIAAGYYMIQKADSPKDKHLDLFGGAGLLLVMLGGIALAFILIPNGMQDDWVKAGRIFKSKGSGPSAPSVQVTPNGLEFQAKSGNAPQEVSDWFITIRLPGDGSKKQVLVLPPEAKSGEVFYIPSGSMTESKATQFARP